MGEGRDRVRDGPVLFFVLRIASVDFFDFSRSVAGAWRPADFLIRWRDGSDGASSASSSAGGTPFR